MPPENMVVFNVREDQVSGIFTAIVGNRGGALEGPRSGEIYYACRSLEDFRDACCFLAARESICVALAEAWRRLEGVASTQEDRLACLEVETAYFQATGKLLDTTSRNKRASQEAEPLDAIRRGLGMGPKYGHLSEIEVKMFVRDMDRAAGREYNEAEPIESQAKRLAAKLQEDVAQTQLSNATRDHLNALAEQLEAGFVVDRGMGSLGEVDRVNGALPMG